MKFYKVRDFVYVSGVNPFISSEGIKTQIIIDIYRWGIGILGIAAAIIIILYTIKILSLNSKFIHQIGEIGKKSLQIYLIQKILIEFFSNRVMSNIVQKIGYNPLTKNMIAYNWVITPAISIVYIIIILYIIWILNKIKLSKILFGR